MENLPKIPKIKSGVRKKKKTVYPSKNTKEVFVRAKKSVDGVVDALRTCVDELRQLNKLFYRDGKWQCVEKAEKALAEYEKES